MPTKNAPPKKNNATSGNKSALDWNGARQRLDRLRSAIESGWQLDRERIDAILTQRAKRLAQPMASDIAAQQHIDVLEFSLAREHYGIASDYVREVFPLNELTPVPCTPAFVLGIANLRGEIISIIDIRKFFGLPASGITDLNKVIVLEGLGMTFGLVVDFIVEVRQLVQSDLLPATNISGISAPYLLGVTAQRMAVIDAEKLLGDKKIIVDEVVGNL